MKKFLLVCFFTAPFLQAQELPTLTNDSEIDPVETTEEVKTENTEPSENISQTKTNVLDFEAEVIEGERKTPQLFLQMDVGTPTIDTLLYRRTNFQDFQVNDAKRKPKFRGSVK
jgi:hypothetical protein